MKRIIIILVSIAMVLAIVSCAGNKNDNSVSSNNNVEESQNSNFTPPNNNEADNEKNSTDTESNSTPTSSDKYTQYINNYIGKNVATFGYTSAGGDRLEYYGQGLLRLILKTYDGSYINIEDEVGLNSWRVVAQSLAHNTELKFTYSHDSEGNEYDYMTNFQNYEEIVLLIAPIGVDVEDTTLTEILPSLDRYTMYIRDYVGRNLAQCGYITIGSELRDAYGSSTIRMNIITEDGSYFEVTDYETLGNYIVISQSVDPNTELNLTYRTDSEGNEYDNLIDTQNIEEIDIYVAKIGTVSNNDIAYSDETDTTSDLESNDTTSSEEETPTTGIRPEFKEAMDAYEAFYEEYCDFLKEYSENPTDFKLLTKYGEMVTKAVAMDKAFEDWDEDELTDEELQYYLEVNNRVMQMLADVI